MVGVAVQHLAVGRDRLGELTELCEGVALVVPRVGGIDILQRLPGFLIFAGTIPGGPAPGRIIERPRRVFVPLALKLLRPPLVRLRPKVPPLERLGTVRQHHQQRQHAEQAAATEGQGRDRQQHEDQPRTALDPLFQSGLRCGRIARMARGRIEKAREPVDVRTIGSDRPIQSAALLCNLLQNAGIQFGHQDVAVGILPQPLPSPRHRTAGFGAGPQHRKPVSGLPDFAGGIERQRRVGIAGDQQHMPAPNPGLLQQTYRGGQPGIGAPALNRRQLGAQGAELRRDRGGVLGQRRHRECIAGIDHQAGLAVAPQPQQIGDLVAHSIQTARLQIGRVHRIGHVHHDHQRILVAEHRHRQALPDRPGQRDDRDRAAQRHQPRSPTSSFRGRTIDQQIGKQFGVTDALQRTRAVTQPVQSPDRQHQRQQGQQPERSQEMKILDHDALSRGHSSMAPPTKAKASGQWYSST